MDAWSRGMFTDQSQFGTAIKNAEAIGICNYCEILLTLEYEELLEGSLTDEE